jgi:hypothetical protein
MTQVNLSVLSFKEDPIKDSPTKEAIIKAYGFSRENINAFDAVYIILT